MSVLAITIYSEDPLTTNPAARQSLRDLRLLGIAVVGPRMSRAELAMAVGGARMWVAAGFEVVSVGRKFSGISFATVDARADLLSVADVCEVTALVPREVQEAVALGELFAVGDGDTARFTRQTLATFQRTEFERKMQVMASLTRLSNELGWTE
jgi:hypothetical protein